MESLWRLDEEPEEGVEAVLDLLSVPCKDPVLQPKPPPPVKKEGEEEDSKKVKVKPKKPGAKRGPRKVTGSAFKVWNTRGLFLSILILDGFMRVFLGQISAISFLKRKL